MIILGFLSYHDGYLRIPNREIMKEFEKALKDESFGEVSKIIENSRRMLKATVNRDIKTVEKILHDIHNSEIPILQYNDENSLSSVLTIGYLSAMKYYFKPIRELPSGRGFADFVFIPKPEYTGDYPALVVELKWNKDARTAIQQIKEKKYPDTVRQYTGKMLLVGINYDKKTKEHSCIIEKVDGE